MEVMAADQLLATATAIAARAHVDQYDKAGQPYLGHIRRVASYVDQANLAAVAAALLHDTVEDSDFTTDSLIAAGIPHQIVHAVALLTRRADQTPADYYAAINTNLLAREVKLADLADNTDPARLAKLSEDRQEKLRRKYADAYRALAADPSDGDRRRGFSGRVPA